MRFAGPLALALGFLVAGCGMFDEVAVPAPGDISAMQRPTSPNTCVAAPAGFALAPDLPTRRYDVSPGRLFATVRMLIASRPRTTELSVDSGRLRVDFVTRSLVFRFPDIVLAQVLRVSEEQSDLVLYSYSLKGHYDFGVNRTRVSGLLAGLDVALALPQ